MVWANFAFHLSGPQTFCRSMLPIEEDVAQLLSEGFGQRTHLLAQISNQTAPGKC